MRVYKFGGTSVGSPSRMKSIIPVINDGQAKIVVLSAMAGTTNSLVEIAEMLYSSNQDEAGRLIGKLEEHYRTVVGELLKREELKAEAFTLLESHFNYIKSFTLKAFTRKQEKAILAQGELLSTALFHLSCIEEGVGATLLPALSFMRIDKDGEPDNYYIRENLKRELGRVEPGRDIIITQGYICRDAYGDIDNLKRGGSDYTATIIGAALNADEIQIWTDISGIHNNDPRFVENTRAIRELSFDEAAELAYFGAKILHPASLIPARQRNIPVRLKNTMEPDDRGTLITSATGGEGYKAIAAKDGITAIKIKSARMLLAYGFLRKVFEIFEIYRTPIDMITTSEVAISLTIDDTGSLSEIVTALEQLGTVEVEQDKSIICIVGDFIAEKAGTTTEIFSALKGIPIRMISYGGSRHNISLLVNTSHKAEALQLLSRNLFSD